MIVTSGGDSIATIFREEDGDRVFKVDFDAEPGERIFMLEDGRWVKPSFRPTLGLYMRGTPLSEEEVANLVKSGN